MADWYVGQKVVCVDGEVGFFPGPPVTDPIIGSVYTIREIVDVYSDGLGFRLEEIINPTFEYADGQTEATFDETWFRPIVSQDADISVFTFILDRVNKREAVDA